MSSPSRMRLQKKGTEKKGPVPLFFLFFTVNIQNNSAESVIRRKLE